MIVMAKVMRITLKISKIRYFSQNNYNINIFSQIGYRKSKTA